MEWKHVKGNTWVLAGEQLVGVYLLSPERCILFDPGSSKLREGVEAGLRARGLTPAWVLCTHMHYDHHETSRYFRDTCGAQVCLPQLEAEIVRCEQSLKNHLFNFPMGLIRTDRRLQNLICPVDRVISFGEENVSLEGVTIGVLRTPGHSPDHVCFVTPDDVCFAGDVLMTEDVLETARVPFVFDMEDDLASKALVGRTRHAAWILCHAGVIYGSVEELAENNIRRIRERVAACRALVTGPMTYSQFYAAVVTAFQLPVGHPLRAQHLERYIRPYLEYLIDSGGVELIELDGAAGVRPARILKSGKAEHAGSSSNRLCARRPTDAGCGREETAYDANDGTVLYPEVHQKKQTRASSLRTDNAEETISGAQQVLPPSPGIP